MPKITKIQDNIITIEGKYKYKQDQIWKLSKQTSGLVLSATETEAKLLTLGDPSLIKTKVNATISKASVNDIKVNSAYFGSIINPFGNILFPESKKQGKTVGTSKLDVASPELLDRVKLTDPIKSGILAIDTMIPIGKGQRELIIGDRSTGKTAIALSTIINQKKANVKSIYIGVGQKRNSVIGTYNLLRKHNAHEDVITIFANPDSASEQFLAPRIGMAMAEAIAYQGHDVLVVIDDLTKHANVYREISLSIGKNPGREAYPTDIFYQHSRLLERAGKFNKKYKNGSITCLPIVETVQGDIASLIPSNIISITDGQIFTSADMFNNGNFPAINIGLSVSRTGSAVQSKQTRRIAKGLKADYADLSEVKKFADMSIDLSKTLKKKLERWSSINTLLLQYGFKGYTEDEMEVMIQLFKMNVIDKIEDKRKFSVAFREYSRKDEGAKKLLKELKTKGKDIKWLQESIAAIYLPLIRIASGIKNDIVTLKEFNKYKEGE